MNGFEEEEEERRSSRLLENGDAKRVSRSEEMEMRKRSRLQEESDAVASIMRKGSRKVRVGLFLKLYWRTHT